MVIAPSTFIAVIIAALIFGFLVGDRPKLPLGWGWITYNHGRTVVLKDERCHELISIDRINFLYWRVGSEKFKSLAKAKRHALRMVR